LRRKIRDGEKPAGKIPARGGGKFPLLGKKRLSKYYPQVGGPRKISRSLFEESPRQGGCPYHDSIAGGEREKGMAFFLAKFPLREKQFSLAFEGSLRKGILYVRRGVYGEQEESYFRGPCS